MNFNFSLILLLVLNCSLFSQNFIPCLPSSGGSPATDEPPGCYLCGPIYAGDTHGYTPDSIAFVSPCGTIDNSQWITLEAGTSGSMRIIINSFACQKSKGVEMVLLDENLQAVSPCVRNSPVTVSGIIQATNLIPGSLYHLLIDGVEGDSCEILLTVTDGTSTPPEPPRIIKTHQSPFDCINSEITFRANVPTQKSAEWRVDSTGTIISGQGENPVTISWSTPGKKYIEVVAQGICYTDYVLRDSIEISDHLPYLSKTFVICDGEVLPLKDTIIATNDQGCEFFQIREFEHFIPTPKEFEIKLCTGKTFELPGTNMVFDSTGIYDIIHEGKGQFGCDSLIRLDLEIFPTTVEDLTCIPKNEGLRIEWKDHPNARQFQISINDEFLGYTTRNYYEVSILTPDTFYNFEILPIANDSACLFEPLSIDCGPLTSSTNNFSLSENIQLLPNPTSAKVQITSPTSVEWVRVFDISGREILHSTNLVRLRREVEIDLSGESAGVYFFKVKTKKGINTKRVVLF